jgi:hypothetical protein
MRDRSSLELEPLVDLPASASFTLIQEHPDVLQQQTSSSALRHRRLLYV